MPSYHQLIDTKPGETLFLLGNESIARGLIEAGVAHATTYPGTPSSEVGDVLAEIAKDAGIRFEFSVNEKVALESAFASAASGMRSFVFMKHVGLNVASDPLMSIAYTGVKGPLVIMTADDPSMFSSQDEQDNRLYARLAHIPLLEPSNPQEAKDYLLAAFNISESWGIPVLFRTTTRVSHTRANVTLGPITETPKKVDFKSDGVGYVSIPSNARRFKARLTDRFVAIGKSSYEESLNKTEGDQNSIWGVITSGQAYNVVKDTLNLLGMDIEILKLGFSYPLPEDMIANFLWRHNKMVVVEEVDPVIETELRALAHTMGICVDIRGKMTHSIPINYETSPDTLLSSFSRLFGAPVKNSHFSGGKDELPIRPPVLCPGCPHRATYTALEKAVKLLKIENPIYSSDIGCYSLGYYDPFKYSDFMVDMGASIGIGSGFAGGTDQKIIAFIGDSTFFHSGIPALVNAKMNKSNMLVIVMDNDITAMTGRQPNPGTPASLVEGKNGSISIQKMAEAMNIDYVRTVDPYDIKETIHALMEGLKRNDLSVVIAKRECAILRDIRMRRDGEKVKYQVIADKCSSCFNCVDNFACPAMSIHEGKVIIDPVICDGCGVCSEPYVCPYRAIEVTKNA